MASHLPRRCFLDLPESVRNRSAHSPSTKQLISNSGNLQGSSKTRALWNAYWVQTVLSKSAQSGIRASESLCLLYAIDIVNLIKYVQYMIDIDAYEMR